MSLYLPVLMLLSVGAVIVVHCINSALFVVVVVVVKVFISYVTHSHGECHGLEKVVKYVWASIG